MGTNTTITITHAQQNVKNQINGLHDKLSRKIALPLWILIWPCADFNLSRHIDGLVEDCTNHITNALELPPSCT